MRVRGWPWLGLAALSGLLFFTNLGAAELWDDDEPIFAGAAREMMERREWVVPYFNSTMLPDKPALLYWVMIGAYRVLGVTEFAARSGSAVFGVGTVLVTWWLGRRLFSPAAGVWAGVVLATTMNFDVVARAATPDAPLTFFSTLAIGLYAVSRTGAAPATSACQANRWRWLGRKLAGRSRPAPPQPPAASWLAIVASYFCMGMAVLAKGPIGVLLPAMTIGLYELTASALDGHIRGDTNGAGWRNIAERFRSALVRFISPRRMFAALVRMRPFVGLAIVLAVAAPWYVAVGWRTEGAWLAGFFGKHNLGRFLHPMEHHRGPFFYYLVALVIGFFPWSLFFGPTCLYLKSQLAAESPARERHRLLVCWVVAYLAFFSLAATKLPSYVVPAYPALALLVGAWIDAWVKGRQAAPATMMRVAWIATIVVGIAMTVALPLITAKFLGSQGLLAFTGLPWTVGGVVCWWHYHRARRRRALVSFAVTAVAASLAIFAGGATEVGGYQSSALFAEEVHRQTGGEPALVRSAGYWRPSLVFYLRQPVTQFFSDEEVRDFCRRWPYRGFLLLTGERYARVAEWLPPDVTILARHRWFLRPDDLVLLGRADASQPPLERFTWQAAHKH